MSRAGTGAARTIYLYEGRGTGEFTRACAWIGLERELGSLCTIRSLDAAALNDGAWLADAVLLVIPGGADRPYVEDIDARGLKSIRELVERGGAVLGLCAGAYYLCERIDFTFAGGQRVQAERPARLFPGLARGPLLDLAGPYDESSAHAAGVASLRDDKGVAYRALYWGGPELVPREPVDGLAGIDAWLFYRGPGDRIAAATVRHGQGRVVVCGVHAEVDSEQARIGFSSFTRERAHVGVLVRALAEAETGRAALWRRLIAETGVGAGVRAI